MLDELAREGARRMLISALEEEVAAYVERHANARDADGRRLVVRNGQARARGITCGAGTCGAGTLEVRAPRVNDRRVDEEGERCRFTSRILPPYMRHASLAEGGRGATASVFAGALDERLPAGTRDVAQEEAAGLSATNIARLTGVWEEEYRQFRKRSLKDSDYVYAELLCAFFSISLIIMERVGLCSGFCTHVNEAKCLDMVLTGRFCMA
jgi:putative transposase